MGIVFGGKSSNLSGYSSISQRFYGCLIESSQANEIELSSQGNIIIENIVADGYLIYLSEGIPS